ncbi:MAG: hypothetical protein H6834_14545 [Planctomycetes bacterium]|nr:hypothetical protein [Planctomycetota bacterium]
MPVFTTTAHLATIPTTVLQTYPPTLVVWSLASKLSYYLIGNQRIVPCVVRRDGRVLARWGAALAGSEDMARVQELASAMPPAAHAVPVPGARKNQVWAPEALLREFLDANVDEWVRSSLGPLELPRIQKRKANANEEPWERRFQQALRKKDPAFEAAGFRERTLVDDLIAWSRPARGERERPRACFRLDVPNDDQGVLSLHYLLQALDDPSLLITAREVWSTKGRSLGKLGRAFHDPQEALLEALGRTARLFPPIEESLSLPRPENLPLDAATAWTFLTEGAPMLAEAGFGVIVPSELTGAGRRQGEGEGREGEDLDGEAQGEGEEGEPGDQANARALSMGLSPSEARTSDGNHTRAPHAMRPSRSLANDRLSGPYSLSVPPRTFVRESSGSRTQGVAPGVPTLANWK